MNRNATLPKRATAPVAPDADSLLDRNFRTDPMPHAPGSCQAREAFVDDSPQDQNTRPRRSVALTAAPRMRGARVLLAW